MRRSSKLEESVRTGELGTTMPSVSLLRGSIKLPNEMSNQQEVIKNAIENAVQQVLETYGGQLESMKMEPDWWSSFNLSETFAADDPVISNNYITEGPDYEEDE